MKELNYWEMDVSRRRRLLVRVDLFLNKMKMSRSSNDYLRIIERAAGGVYPSGRDYLDDCFHMMPRLLKFYYIATFDLSL